MTRARPGRLRPVFDYGGRPQRAPIMPAQPPTPDGAEQAPRDRAINSSGGDRFLCAADTRPARAIELASLDRVDRHADASRAVSPESGRVRGPGCWRERPRQQGTATRGRPTVAGAG